MKRNERLYKQLLNDQRYNIDNQYTNSETGQEITREQIQHAIKELMTEKAKAQMNYQQKYGY